MDAPTSKTAVPSSAVPGSLSPQRRAVDVERLSNEPLDILVIGGGVTGVGCALDAVTRGLKVGLVEQRDLASGTSSRSSKLLHGGLRYLEQRDFALVREALHERGLLARTVSPHLVRTVSFMIPLTRRFWQRIYYGAGVLLYDLLARTGKNPLPLHRHLGRKAALKLAPGLKRSSLVGAITYQDAQIDDARHTLAIARTACEHGASIVTSTRVTGLLIEDLDGVATVVGAKLRDLETNTDYECRAAKVINATGVWLDDIHDMVTPSTLAVRAAKGVHLVVPKDCFDSECGVVLRTDRSVLFLIPWGEHWLIGTTDTEWSFDRAHPAASSADIDYILDHANKALERPLTRADILGVYVGLRPLLDPSLDDTAGGDTAKLSREHAVAEPIPGLVSIAGGKYTTYRVMAADAVNAAVEGLRAFVPPSCTHEVVLLGSGDWQRWSQQADALAKDSALDREVIERLLWRHGNRIVDVLEMTRRDPSLAAQLPGGTYIAAEVVHAARHEGALHLDDVLARRLRISIEGEQRGNLAAERVASLMAAELGWSDQRRSSEVKHWYERVEAERAANAAPDDSTADSIRRRAADTRGLIEA
ncbi:MAG: glycerol-3-phosphate dehydrogenase/oxidase [Acidimicrobiaceae bacterium]|nr:glycerol-3-phosphate dehydrogenase/oxidase [Acidimicrobiaceae bacterium]MXW75229.1 glycerol-3-phosphate dehydrogenase/oxidase [Acidimicrobiaceae bacterium]MYC42352.1 glycerol-3-phosphate dehydrogenase/oxidase [Acidimicrobiaceae bacterium]MYD06310.1 glycerol-3-phosphate dehydrogenase/oxidase [Acidimicrobiaceae bacterium]MYI59301.1 glycerol-3-phosphate dehydrogenase/oxidase [Acidimicrobiaceae bacterium]